MSFTQGLSGLNAADKDLSVIGNNVANANTVGFKESQAQFADVFAAALSGAGSSQIGIGTKLATVAQQFIQGNISVTNNTLDMAINGPGFFILDNGHGVGYSRNGQFELDKDGFIVSSTGAKLQGYLPDPVTGQMTGSPQTLSIPTGIASASQSTQVTAGLNLDSRSLMPSFSPFDATDPTTYNNSTSTTTYDSLGNAQITTMYFVKSAVYDSTNAIPSVLGSAIASDTPSAGMATVTLTNPISAADLFVGASIQGANFPAGTTITGVSPAGGPYTSFTTSANPSPALVAATSYPLTIELPNSWDVYTTVTDPVTGTSLFSSSSPVGTLSFTTNGTYNGFDTALAGPPVHAPLTFTPPGASAEAIAFDFTGASQFGANFGVTKLTQDGYTSGQLSGFSVAPDGTIQGRYSNGITKGLGQVALATFPNMQGLQPLGDNQWAETSASGQPTVNAPGTGNNGVLQTSATEDSNVDLTAELVNMITAQRWYQANAQTIKTEDAMMQTIVNLR
jgi:flagellar hook protein FlgE